MKIILTVWLVSLSAFAISAEAKTLVVVKGKALVSQGEGYTPVTDAREVSVGDTILINPGDEARIDCSDAQSLILRQPGYYRVPADCGAASAAGLLEGLGALAPLAAGVAVLGGAIAIIQATEDKPASN